MDVKTKLKSVIIFSYTALGLSILVPVVSAIFTVPFFTFPRTIVTYIFGILVWNIMALMTPFALIIDFSSFIQQDYVRNVLFLIMGLLNYIAVTLFLYSRIHFKEKLKNNKSLQKHFNIILGIYLGIIVFSILFLTITLNSMPAG